MLQGVSLEHYELASQYRRNAPTMEHNKKLKPRVGVNKVLLSHLLLNTGFAP